MNIEHYRNDARKSFWKRLITSVPNKYVPMRTTICTYLLGKSMHGGSTEYIIGYFYI